MIKVSSKGSFKDYFCDYESHGRTGLSKGDNIKLVEVTEYDYKLEKGGDDTER